MYYPYLRGKQFELIALRELARELPNNDRLCPIIEPVKSNFNSLNAAIRELKGNHEHFVLVINPSDGDFRNNREDIIGNLNELDESNWVPALLYERNCLNLKNILLSKGLENVSVVFKNGIDFDQDAELEDFLSLDAISSVVISNADTRVSKRRLQNLGKAIIRLDDNFHEKKRNADYINAQDEQFTEEPFYYQGENFAGFSDYTTLPKLYTEGGMLPYAVAIHLTYKPIQEMVYIHHFVSDTNYNQSNIQGKFAEAARKAVVFFITTLLIFVVRHLKN